MPNFKLPLAEEGQTNSETLQNLLDTMLKYRKELNFLLQNLDSLNVADITTNFTKIHSKNGETIIDGPQLYMTDRNILRLLLGYNDNTNSFGFTLYDELGVPTIDLDSTGQAMFRGVIRVLSDELGLTEINGPTINMYDNTYLKRLQLGYDELEAKFIFRMWDMLGQPSIDINDLGEAVFKGSIETLKDAYVGNNIYLGTTGDSSIVMSGAASIDFDYAEGSMFLSALNYVQLANWWFSSTIVNAESELDMNGYNINNVGNIYTKTQVDSAIQTALQNHVSSYHIVP